MRCKYCGGEVNLSVGKCVRCGRGVDETSDIRLVHDLGILADKYGAKTGENEEPERKRPPRANDSEWHELAERSPAARAEPEKPDLKTAKKPTIGLSTYLELLGGEEPDKPEKPAAEDSAETEVVPTDLSAETEEESGNRPEGRVAALISRARKMTGRLAHRMDELTAPATERVRQWYHTKVPELNRAQSKPFWERMAVIGAALAVLAVIVVIISSIVSAIPNSIVGEWQVSESGAQSRLTMRFDSDGTVSAFVYSDDEAHLYKSGEYTTQRQNGRNLLIITFDDGTLSHLYYDLSGSTGTFTNVDTNLSAEYSRLG